jgi:hypothetical protein
VEAVRAHEDVGVLLAAGQRDPYAAFVLLLEAFHLGAEAQGTLAHLSHEQGLKVSPVDGGARDPELLLQFSRGDAREYLPAPGAYLAGSGGCTQVRNLLGEPELSKSLLGVGGEQ